MRHPRWLNEFWAWLLGYFWIPCPICKENFGGHEWGREGDGTFAVIKRNDQTGEGVCYKQSCVAEAGRINRSRGLDHDSILRRRLAQFAKR